MKKNMICLFGVLLVLASCDPKYPLHNLKIGKVDPLQVGESVELQITYPDDWSAYVIGWKNTQVEILKGEDVILISGLIVTGVKSGKATIKVSATTILDEECGEEERLYSSTAKIIVR